MSFLPHFNLDTDVSDLDVIRIFTSFETDSDIYSKEITSIL